MTQTIKNYLELARIPGVFTAVSNILMGYALAYGDYQVQQIPSLLYLVAASSLLYAGGMALNDFFDYRGDATEHPKRVIPSGRIKARSAGIFSFSVLVLACVVAVFSGITSLAITALMAALIVVYNRYSKRIFIVGPLNMASIRFLNVLLGASAVVGVNESSSVLPAAAFAVFIFVFGITVISRREGVFLRDNTAPGLILVGVVAAYVAGLAIMTDGGVNAASWYVAIFVAAFALLSLLLPYKTRNAKVEHLIASFVISIILLDAALISATGEVYFAVLVALLYIPALALSRVIKVS